MAISPAIAERLPRQLYQCPIIVLPQKRQVIRKRIAVPEILVLHQQLQAVGALGARAPSDRPLPSALLDHRGSLLYNFPFLLQGQIPRHFVMIAVAGDLVTVLHDRFHLFRIALGDAAAGEKRRSDSCLFENPENPPDAGPRSVFRLGPFFMIHLAVLIRLHVLPTLKVKGQRDGHAPAIRPCQFILNMTLLNHFRDSFPGKE